MSIEQHFAAAINADPDDRTLQLVYADWLEEQGDPRAEAWRVLIEAGKRPANVLLKYWHWWLENGVGNQSASLPRDWPCMDDWYFNSHGSYHAAMNAAAIAWVRCHRDAGFEPDELTERVS